MTEDEKEYYNERAAILEYEAGYTREEAERIARNMMIERRLKIES